MSNRGTFDRMLGGRQLRDLTIFVSLYLLLSLPPFLALNRVSGEAVNLAIAASLGMVALAAVAGLFLAEEGVNRFTQFLFAPTDLLSIIVDLTFVLAATSWWLVLEVAVYYDLNVDLTIILGGIVLCHIPMIFFLSLMTALGQAQES